MDFPQVFPYQVTTIRFFSAPKVLKNQMTHRGSKLPWLSPVHATENICLLCLCAVLRKGVVSCWNLCLGNWSSFGFGLLVSFEAMPIYAPTWHWTIWTTQALVWSLHSTWGVSKNGPTQHLSEVPTPDPAGVRTQPRCWCSVHWCPKS